MYTVTMLDLRKHAQEIINRFRRGEQVTLTYRGEEVCTMVPCKKTDAADIESDPFFDLVGSIDESRPLTNEQIDEVLYDADLC